jgi:fructose-bisphosphate aldolase class II
VEQAHAEGIAVEAELGLLKGIEEGVGVDAQEAILTDPAQAEEFVNRTGCDSLAVAIGTSHGAYKFAGKQRLHLDRLADIQTRLPKFPLVLHGGSAVPLDEIERINGAGGAIDSSASGVSDQELARAISLGITKVNIGTDGRLIWTRVHREFFNQTPKEFDFMLPGRTYMEAYAALVAAKCEKLGAAGATKVGQRFQPACADREEAGA